MSFLDPVDLDTISAEMPTYSCILCTSWCFCVQTMLGPDLSLVTHSLPVPSQVRIDYYFQLDVFYVSLSDIGHSHLFESVLANLCAGGLTIQLLIGS